MYTPNLIKTATDVIWFFLHFSSFSTLVYHILVNKAISFFHFVLSSHPFIYFIVSSLGLLGERSNVILNQSVGRLFCEL
jgi:hypothetical protein